MSDRIKILLIEDSPSDQQLIRSLLSDVQAVQFACEWTGSLGDGLARLSTGEFQAVLLDLSLPDSHGLETYERVVPVCESIPVIVLTGHEDEELALAALERGAQDYLTKGEISSDLLARTLRYAMGRKRAEEALQRARTELEERVRERTAELTEANRELAHEVQVRVQAERAVRDSERLLKQFVEAMPVGVFVAHVDGTPYFANELAVELFGPEILQTKSLEDLAGVFRGFQSGTDQIYHASRTPVMRALQGEKSSIADMVVERNNRRIPLQAWGSPVLDSSGNVRLAVTAFVDISERLAIEERARQTQQDLAHLSRLNTMGEMASGLAHELNQPLMAIVAYIRSCILNLNGGQWKLEKDRDTLCKVLEDAAAE